MSTNKNILFLIPSLTYGGAEIQTIQQCNSLYESGWQVFLCVLTQQVPLLPRLKLPKENILLLNVKSNTLHFKSAVIKIPDILKLRSFVKKKSITHVIANLPLCHWYGRILKFFCRQVKLYNYHRSLQYAANPLNTFGKRLFNNIQALLARYTDDVSICISNAVQQNIQAHFYLKNPVVIYNSIQDVYDNTCTNSFQVKETGKINIVLPGRLHFSKGQLFFLSVLSLMEPNLRNKVQVIFAGGGALQTEINQYLIEHKLNEIVKVTGFLENADLLAYMKGADFLVIPSLHEGLGNVAIEALMLGKTVVSSIAGGLKEVIFSCENGYTFQTGNYQDCLSVLTKVIQGMPDSIFPVEVLRNDYRSRFSSEAHLERLTSIL